MKFQRKINNYLKIWAETGTPKPLILRGARQVGKTTTVKQFARESNLDLVYIDLEAETNKSQFSGDIDIKQFEERVNLFLGQELIPGKTLLFLDEIQAVPSLLNMLRYFYEQKKGLHVVAAGSLLDIYLNEENTLSFPVGRISYAYLGPLDFFEFLQAIGETKSLEILRNYQFPEKIDESIHNHFLKLLGEYMLIGGMPEAVSNYSETKDYNQTDLIQQDLLKAFNDDIGKYANKNERVYLSHVLSNAPIFVGKSIKYEKFAGSEYRSREMGEAFRKLQMTRILYLANQSRSKGLPLIPALGYSSKLLFLDSGLVNSRLGNKAKLYEQIVVNKDFQGQIVEQYVGQSMLNYFNEKEQEVFYWEKDNNPQAAEVDFCVMNQGQLYALEVKSGATGKLKSLFSYKEHAAESTLVRLYSGYARDEQLNYAGKEYNIKSLPLYLLPRLFELV